MIIPAGEQADFLLWGGDGLTVASPGGFLKFTEGRKSGNNRRFSIDGGQNGFGTLEAKAANGGVWDTLRIVFATAIEQRLRRQAITLLNERAISKMNFQIGGLHITPQKLRGVQRLLRQGEILIRHDPAFGQVAFYLRKDHLGRGADSLVMPYSDISTLEQKANACHEMVHAAIDHYYAGQSHPITVSESAGYVAQMIYLRVALPQQTLTEDMRKRPVVRESFLAAGEVLAGKGISKTRQYRLRNAIAAHPTYRQQVRERKSNKYDGV